MIHSEKCVENEERDLIVKHNSKQQKPKLLGYLLIFKLVFVKEKFMKYEKLSVVITVKCFNKYEATNFVRRLFFET